MVRVCLMSGMCCLSHAVVETTHSRSRVNIRLPVACSLVMMGDDTWAALYPRQFARQHDYPSLNVFDLHTVDNGCLDNVWKYIGGDGARVESNWTVLVSHFLG